MNLNIRVFMCMCAECEGMCFACFVCVVVAGGEKGGSAC